MKSIENNLNPASEGGEVIIYASGNGKITRAEAADLCKLGVRQAGHLLARLVKAKKLNLYGTRKGAWYALRL